MRLPLNSTACAMCGQCAAVCPTGALSETDALAPVWRALADPAKRVVVHASGADEKGRGQANMVVTATLTRAGRGTKVGVAQDLQLSGAAAQYGRGMISDVSAVLMRDFSANMQNRIERIERGESAEQIAAASAAPARGFTLGLRAAVMALSRVFRRFFLPYQPAS